MRRCAPGKEIHVFFVCVWFFFIIKWTYHWPYSESVSLCANISLYSKWLPTLHIFQGSVILSALLSLFCGTKNTRKALRRVTHDVISYASRVTPNDCHTMVTYFIFFITSQCVSQKLRSLVTILKELKYGFHYGFCHLFPTPAKEADDNKELWQSGTMLSHTWF